ncbi:MAG: hypothetical protein HY565_02495 [Candidatus Kerfeldbacteria bacterium]|nr:hypothetical protein [Candidatus Kerfeldbacteria bacterium]
MEQIMHTPILPVAFFFFFFVVGAPASAAPMPERTDNTGEPSCLGDGYPLPESPSPWLVDLYLKKQVEWLEDCSETAGGPITSEQLVRAEILREEYGEQLYLVSMRFGMHETARELRQVRQQLQPEAMATHSEFQAEQYLRYYEFLLETRYSMDSLAQVYCQGFYKIPRVFRWWFVYEYSPCWECLIEEPAESE